GESELRHSVASRRLVPDQGASASQDGAGALSFSACCSTRTAPWNLKPRQACGGIMTTGINARQRITILLIVGLLLAPVAGALRIEETRAQSMYEVLVSISSTRSNPASLEGRTVAGNIYPFTAPDTANIVRV